MNEREALLAQLRGLEMPPVEGGPAPLWWALLALAVATALAALGAFARRRVARRRRRDAWRGEARAELDALRAASRSHEGPAEAELLARASVLARRTLLAVSPRHDVAALHGERWLRALDAAGRTTAFTRGPGRALASGPFERRVALPPDQLEALLDALGALIERVTGATPS